VQTFDNMLTCDVEICIFPNLNLKTICFNYFALVITICQIDNEVVIRSAVTFDKPAEEILPSSFNEYCFKDLLNRLVCIPSTEF